MSFPVANIAAEVPFPEVIERPAPLIQRGIGSAFVTFVDKTAINVFESFFPSKFTTRPSDVFVYDG